MCKSEIDQRSGKILKKKNVELIDAHENRFRCCHCGIAWSPNIQTGGKQPQGYWHCPNGCNKPEKSFAKIGIGRIESMKGEDKPVSIEV